MVKYIHAYRRTWRLFRLVPVVCLSERINVVLAAAKAFTAAKTKESQDSTWIFCCDSAVLKIKTQAAYEYCDQG